VPFGRPVVAVAAIMIGAVEWRVGNTALAPVGLKLRFMELQAHEDFAPRDSTFSRINS
jgi:hypothetical protein